MAIASLAAPVARSRAKGSWSAPLDPIRIGRCESCGLDVQGLYAVQQLNRCGDPIGPLFEVCGGCHPTAPTR